MLKTELLKEMEIMDKDITSNIWTIRILLQRLNDLELTSWEKSRIKSLNNIYVIRVDSFETVCPDDIENESYQIVLNFFNVIKNTVLPESISYRNDLFDISKEVNERLKKEVKSIWIVRKIEIAFTIKTGNVKDQCLVNA